MSDIKPASGLNQVIALRQQILERNDALRELRESTSGAVGTQASSTEATGFASTLSNAVQEVSAAQKRAGDMAAAYERGEVTDIAQVMLARQESSIAFEATLQVRNKLLTAYQDIMRMGA